MALLEYRAVIGKMACVLFNPFMPGDLKKT